MNPQTPQVTQFVLYSIHELVHQDGAGFWSNDNGWVEFKSATRFTLASVPSCNLPISDGQDAKWIMWEPEPQGGRRATARPSQVSLSLSTH